LKGSDDKVQTEAIIEDLKRQNEETVNQLKSQINTLQQSHAQELA